MANAYRDVAWVELHGRLYHLCTRVVCLATVELSFICLYAVVDGIPLKIYAIESELTRPLNLIFNTNCTSAFEQLARVLFVNLWCNTQVSSLFQRRPSNVKHRLDDHVRGLSLPSTRGETEH